MKKTKIAVIDDRQDARNMVASAVGDAIARLEISNEWTVLESAPFPKLKNYADWVNKEQIGVVIVDERLGEVPDTLGKRADYKGSDLVNMLRKQFKDMPIYGVTSHADDQSLKDHFALFDAVIRREEFTENVDLYVERFLRTYKNFLDSNEKELSELSVISKKIAEGKATTAQKKRAEAIQQNLEIPITTLALSNRKEWLDEYEKMIKDIKKTQQEAQKFLNKKKKINKK